MQALSIESDRLETGIFLISREQINHLIGRLQKGSELEACIDEVKRMVQIKSTLLWRADAACSCVGNGPATTLFMELSLLENALDCLEQGDVAAGASLLREFLDLFPDEEVT